MNIKYKLSLFAVLILFIPVSLLAQNQLYGQIGNFRLQSGKIIEHCRIGYRTYGSPNSSFSNVILFPTWFGGNTKDLAGLVGPGKMINSSKYFVITVDALGDGRSSSPSNDEMQPNQKFPKFTIDDMVRAEHALLTGVLSIRHVYAVVGISMGGMQTFQWLTLYPNFMKKAIPIVGSPRLTSYDDILWTSELRAINEGLDSNAPEELIAKTVNAIHTMNLTTPDYRISQTPPSAFDSFMKKSDQNFMKTFNPYDWASQLRAMMAQNIYAPFHNSIKAAAATVKAKVLIVVSLQDHMVNPHPAMAFAPLIHAKLLKLNSDCGHLATGCKAEVMDAAIHKFLAN